MEGKTRMQSVFNLHRKQWKVRPVSQGCHQMARSLKISPVVAQILINRNVTDIQQARKFLYPKLTELIEPEKMPGVLPAVDRLCCAIDNNEHIAIYGDYDVDGITSVAILWHMIELLGGSVEYYIPHRIDEGYGINSEAIKQLSEHNVDLIVTVDCGITATEEIQLASSLGMDVIVTDHHRPKETMPGAVSIVHPAIEPYDNPDSAGAMVAFKLAWAIVNRYKQGSRATGKLREFLLNATTLAAIGTIADVVYLGGENRILASYGLKALVQNQLPGIRALIDSAELTNQNLDSYDIGFKLAPMLNAAGRMGHARLAVELLTCENEYRCIQIARYLKDQNRLRQQCQRQIFKEAKAMITASGLNHPDRKTIVLANENWHTGVVGIVASKIVDTFHKPAIMINTGNGDDFGLGSARSIEGFNLHDAISACSEHLESFGGHAMAAGLKVHRDKVAEFSQSMEKYAQEFISDEIMTSTLDIDIECRIKDLCEDTVKQINLLEPFGQGNHRPVFATRAVRCISPPRCVGARGDHLQVSITDDTASVRCIGFNMGKLEKKLLETEVFHVAYEPRLNTFRGVTTVQFVLNDIQFD